MTLKTRLRRFWRNNKKCGGMWAMLLQIPAIVTPPYGFVTLLTILIACIFGVVWKLDRRICLYNRISKLLMYRTERDTKRYVKEFVDYECTIALLKMRIEKLQEQQTNETPT